MIQTQPVPEEHILVCLSSAPSNARIIQTAAGLANAFGGLLTALYVQTPATDRLSPGDQQRLQRHIHLAESLGAAITTVNGEDISYQIAEFARLSKVTKVVIGRSGMTRKAPWQEKPLTEKLIALAPNLDIYIIPDAAGENARPGPVGMRPIFPTGHQWLVTGLSLAAATGLGFGLQALNLPEASIITVYILCSLVAALLTRNFLCSALGALVSGGLFTFFFAAPRFSFQAEGTGYGITFLIMLTASLLTAGLAGRLSDHARQSASSAARTKVLFETNQLLQKAADDREILSVTGGQVMKLLNRPVVVYPLEGSALGAGEAFLPEKHEAHFFQEELPMAQWVLEHKTRAGAGTEHYGKAGGLYLTIHSGGIICGVIGIHLGDKPLEPFENSVVLSILGECALAMESRRNAREKEAAAILAKNEQLRADLLRAISHDLRTPLTSISGNAENLLTNGHLLDPRLRDRLLKDIYDDSSWLIQLVENLLSITRIGEGRTQLRQSPQLVDEVIEEALRHIRREHGGHRILTRIPEELLLANMDARLISQVIVNLVDNAIKYTPNGSTILVSARREGAMAAISVADNGPGIPDALKPKVFEMFFTGENRVADCRRSLGLGLSLCQSIVLAHGGQITLTDNQPTGCNFTFTIPASEVTLNE